jgi:transposase-like protein
MAERPPRDVVVALVEVDGLTPAEAASRTGWPPGTVRQWLTRHRRATGATPAATSGKVGGKRGKAVAAPPPEAPARARPTADALPPDDRARLVQQARDLMATADRLRAKVDAELLNPDFSPSTLDALTRATGNTTRALNDLVRAFPGLMAEVERKADRNEDALADRVAETYGIAPTEPPTE